MAMEKGRIVLAIAALAFAQAVPAGDAQPSAPVPGTKDKAAGKAPVTVARMRYTPDRFAGKAGRYYKYVWGVDSLSVKLVESDQLVRFAWRVVDPERARVLHDKKLEPSLVDPGAGVSLVVPAMEKIGSLRQGVPPTAGKSYWMAFSNTGRKVKRGDRVSVVIGQVRADGLVVD
jgi:hypothetical protein